MIRIYYDEKLSLEIKDLSSVDFGEGFPVEVKTVNFYIVADTEMRDLYIELKDLSGQIVVQQPPREMKRGEIWKGLITWNIGSEPAEQKPIIKIAGTEVLNGLGE